MLSTISTALTLALITVDNTIASAIRAASTTSPQLLAEANTTHDNLEPRYTKCFTFYSDPLCSSDRVWGVSYSVDNPGCFSNPGPYPQYVDRVNFDYHIKQWAGTGSAGCNVEEIACVNFDPVFKPEEFSPHDWDCVNMEDVGFKPGIGSYRISAGSCS